MPSPTLTIIFGYRNREPERVDRCLASLAAQTRKDFVVLFVDYGSWPAQAAAARAVVEKYPFARYIYADTRGWAWNRSHALNIGIRLADSPFIMTSDVDVVYPEQFTRILLAAQEGLGIIHCAPVLLDKGVNNWRALSPSELQRGATRKAHRGVCQCFPHDVAVRLHGFDEAYQVWGIEDTDFAQRATRLGLEERWIEDRVGLYHIWHPADRNRTKQLAWALLWNRLVIHYEDNQFNEVRNDDNWGHLTTKEDRQVYRYLDSENVESIRESGALVWYEYDPADADSLTGLYRYIYSLKAGQAMVVKGTRFPVVPEPRARTVQRINSLFGRFRTGLHLVYPQNYLHTLLEEYIATRKDVISDCYIRCGPNLDATMVVRK